ncbi:MAG: cytochrome P450 [Polyangiaceae bacterium]|nr:cytochrome P450 [Polyangiaceae bacterium]
MRLEEISSLGSAATQLRLIREDRVRGLLQFNDDHGDIGRFGFVFGDVVIVNAPEMVHDVLVTHASSFQKSPIMRSALFPLAGEGLFTSEGELWRKQRKLMAPLFKTSALGSFAADMTSCTERSTATWTDGQVVDMSRETTRITMAIAGKTLFDTDTFDEADELGEALTTALQWAGDESGSGTLMAQARASIGLDLLADRLSGGLEKLARQASLKLLKPILWPSARTRDLKRAVAVLDDRVDRMIAERRASAGGRHDLLSLLLSARDDEGRAMSDRQVRDEVLTLFVAGHETTASGLAWALMLLAQHPSIYRAVRAEVDAIGHIPTMQDLPKLDLSLRVFKESLRMYPPVYMFGRVAVETVNVGKYELPKGTVVLLSPFALQRRKEIWPNPDVFDPDRFKPEEEAKRHKSAFIPFSSGPRTCIGNHFALMEGPLVLATILHRADVEMAEGATVTPEAHATLRPKGMKMRVKLRPRIAANESTARA